MKAFRSPPRSQRGVALIIALILVALATILATKLSFDGYLERQRSIGVLAAEQAMQFGLGAEALAADVLSQSSNQFTTLADPWAQPTQSIPITPSENPDGEPIGAMQGSLEDMEGRFNLNSLAYMTTPTQATGAQTVPSQQDPQPLLQFQRLLVAVGLEPKWAGIARDWIDADEAVGSPDGAEDSVYTSQTPPYRTGNYPMMSPSELMNMPGFGWDRYRKIAPYVTALPTSKPAINICTAPAPVLESLSENFSGEFSNPEFLATGRQKGCFPDIDTLKKIAGSKDAADVTRVAVTASSFFRLTTRVTLGTSEFTLYSLLYRTGGNKVTPILRSFGTP
ncbi:MAG TPA: type II secretion system minor pseudopilin GspK [Steroidobacteraceae bacterium]|jgi:general secretion pathway protein K